MAKIAFLSPFYPYRGGIAQFSDSLFMELKKSHEVKAFTFKRQYPKILFPGTSQYVLDTDRKKDIDAEQILDSINPFSYYKTARKIIEYNPDFLLMSYWMPFFAPSLGKVAAKVREKGIKVISILHNVIPHETRTGDKALTKYFLRRNDGVIILNEKSKSDLFNLQPDLKYVVLTHPLYSHYGDKIDINEARTKLGIPLDKNVILFFGLIRDYKGLDILIEAVSLLDENYILVIAGESYGSFEKYNKKIKELNIEDRVIQNIKYIPDSDVPFYFSACDVCVLPYRSGTQSGIIGISYHFDLPVIVTDVGGLKEMVEEGLTGLIVKQPSAKLISEEILKYFNNNLKEIFQKEIQEYKKLHSWQNFVNSFWEFLRKM